MNCRHCGSGYLHPVLDLGHAPPSNRYRRADELGTPEIYYPLRTVVCERCLLVQTEDYAAAAELFTEDYAYFSSVSAGWVAHARRFSHDITNRLGLDQNSLVIEVACNDGYLLRHFVDVGIPCLGIEPTASTAAAAESLGIPVRREFFGAVMAEELVAGGRTADLIVGNNVLAHVPDINDFCRGLQIMLKTHGVVTLEFPHLMQLVAHCQFDTIYHEHFSYLSLQTVSRIFESVGLRVWDVEELATHGGSLRVYGCRWTDERATRPSVAALMEREQIAGLGHLATYQTLQPRADTIKNNLLEYLIQQRQKGRGVVAYGAAAKGNTLLNYAGVRRDLVAFVCDASPSKQGKLMPGSHIPIVAPERLNTEPVDDLLILPWNIADEITAQYAHLRERGVKFMTAMPGLRTL